MSWSLSVYGELRFWALLTVFLHHYFFIHFYLLLILGSFLGLFMWSNKTEGCDQFDPRHFALHNPYIILWAFFLSFFQSLTIGNYGALSLVGFVFGFLYRRRKERTKQVQ